MKRPAPTLLLPCCLLAWAACGGEPAESAKDPKAASAAPQDPSAPPAGFDVWHRDFPFEVHLSPSADDGRYSFSRRQALERLVERLSGSWTREGWHMAREFFGRAPEDAIPLLVEALDRAMQSPHLADTAQNTVEAMGRMGRFGSEELAAAILRALAHQKVAVQNSAMGALAQAGTAETVRRARRYVDGLQLRAQSDWLRAVRLHLPDEREEIFGQLLTSENARVFPLVVEQVLLMEPAAAARVLGPLWDELRGPVRLSVAAVLHATGDERGTAVLRAVLHGNEPEAKLIALGALRQADLERFGDDVLKLSLDEDQEVRTAVAGLIGAIPGENTDNVLSVLSLDASPEVRAAALRSLWQRGKREQIDRLIETVRTGTGSNLVQALSDLSAAGIGEAVPVIYERMKASPTREWRKYVQAIGRSGADAAVEPLKELFLGPEQPIDHAGGETTLTYAAVLLPNLRGSLDRLLGLLQEIPREDYRRRAYVMHRAGVAAVDADRPFAERVYDTYRAILGDRQEIPQMRLLALEYLRRDLTLEDMERIKKMQDQETGAMRRALVDFLFEFF